MVAVIPALCFTLTWLKLGGGGGPGGGGGGGIGILANTEDVDDQLNLQRLV